MPGAGICGLRGELLDFSRICAAIVIEKIPGEMYNLKIARSIWAGFKALPRECRSIYLNRAVPAAARCASFSGFPALITEIKRSINTAKTA